MLGSGRRRIDRFATSSLFVTALVAGCSGDGLQSQDGLHLHLRWSVTFNDQPSTCAAAGVARVALQDAFDSRNDLGSWPCELLGGTTAAVATTRGDLGLAGNMLLAPAFDQAGFRLTEGGFDTPGGVRFPDRTNGVVDLPPLVVVASDEPIPELRRLFTSASDYYKAHGQLPPSTGGWSTPTTIGACCAALQGACAADPALWAVSPWKDLGFSIEHRFYFSYGFAVFGTASMPAFVVQAGADLACNGGEVYYSITGTWNGAAFSGIDQVTKRVRP
jgi:hypothetical protein